MLRIEVVDLEKAFSALEKAGLRIRDGVVEASTQEAKYELRLSKHRVPWATGELSKSGRVEGPDIAADVISVDIAYGGPAGAGDNSVEVDYAVIVHEDLEAHHLFGRRSKYLESVVREELESGRAAERMGRTILRHLGIGVPGTNAASGTQTEPTALPKTSGNSQTPKWGTFGRKPIRTISRYRGKDRMRPDYDPTTPKKGKY